jgi:hypothetical protein
MRSGLVALVVGASGCFVGGGEQVVAFESATSLSVSLANGSVTIEPTEDGDTVVEWDGGGIGRAAFPEIEQHLDGGVSVDARGQLGGGDVVVHVVPGIPIDVLLDRGDIAVTLAAPADLDLCVAAGSVEVELPPGDYDLDVAAGAGDVTLEVPDVDGAATRISVCAGAGSIDISFATPGIDDFDW